MNQLKDQFIIYDFNLPNHESELCDAEEAIGKIKLKLAAIYKENSINDYIHEYYYEETMRILDYVGRLSVPALALSETIEEMYVLKFPQSPALAKKLWLDHYKDIHHQYNIHKNRCFRILDELDKEYVRVYDKFPPNWKP